MKAIAVTLAVALLALTGCTVDSEEPTKSSSASSKPTRATAPTTTGTLPPPPDKPVQLEANAWLSFGNYLVARTEYTDLDEIGRPAKTTLYHPLLGQLNVDAANLIPGDVVAQRYISSGTAADPTISGVIEVKVPAKDQEPERVVVNLVQIDPKNMSIRHQSEVKRFDTGGSLPGSYSSAVSGLVGSRDGLVAYTIHDPTAPAATDETIGFDVAAGKQVWSRPGRISAAVFDAGGMIVENAGKEDPATPGQFCVNKTLVEVSSGKEIKSFDPEALQTDKAKGCAEVTVRSFPSAGVIAVLVGPRDGDRAVTAYDFADKRDLKLDPRTLVVDEWSDLVLVAPQGTLDGVVPIEIRDAVSGDTVFATADYAVRALLNKQLWVLKGEQRLILDATNGATVKDGWPGFPQYVVGEYVYYSDGTLAKGR